MSRIFLGGLVNSPGRPAWVDLKVLLRTRFLVQAASGGGKSQTLRRLAEQIFGKVPVWIIDKEDEFPSLRDKFGYIFSGPGGETPTDPRSAELVCERLLKAKASAIFGLYSLKDPVRHEWVKLFLNALMNAPKSLWSPMVVMVDESHRFAPEKGQGESVAKEAMIDLAVDGRKHGLCAGFFTQRLGKLSKNASAELLNRMVGKTVEDIDVDRACDLMSVRRADRQDFEEGIKKLKPGQFWCFGDAISTDRILVHVGGVETKHPEPGAPGPSAPPPLPEKMRALLPQLADLPKEAETKARTEAELRAEVKSLRFQLASKLKPVMIPPPPKVVTNTVTKIETKAVEIPVIQASEIKKVHAVICHVERAILKMGPILGAKDELRDYMDHLSGQLSDAVEAAENFRKPPPKTMTILVPKPERIPQSVIDAQKPMLKRPMKNAPAEMPAQAPAGDSLLAGERKMLGVLAQFHPGSRTRSQLGKLSGYTPSGGTFGQYYGKLKRLKLIQERSDGGITITEAGLEWFGGEIPEGPKSAQELLDMWRGKLLKGERKMLDTLVQEYPNTMTKEELGERSGYESSGGTFGQYFGTLRRNALILVEEDTVKASETLFDMAAT